MDAKREYNEHKTKEQKRTDRIDKKNMCVKANALNLGLKLKMKQK